MELLKVKARNTHQSNSEKAEAHVEKLDKARGDSTMDEEGQFSSPQILKKFYFT